MSENEQHQTLIRSMSESRPQAADSSGKESCMLLSMLPVAIA